MDMYQSIIMTGGISLFHPNNIFGRKILELKHDENKGNVSSLSHSMGWSMDDWLKYLDPLTDECITQPHSVSAEYSLLYALQKNRKLAERPSITLFYTDTFTGQLASHLLKRIFEENFHSNVRLMMISGLDVTDRMKLNKSLGEYMKKLSDVLLEGHKRFTCFAPIGGYKVMTSFGYIVGSFFGYPTAYLHEDHQILHEIPPIPIQINQELIDKNQKILRKLKQKGMIEWSPLPFHIKEVLLEASSLMEWEDDFVFLNPFGIFICNQPQYAAKFQTQFFLSEAAWKVLNQKYPSRKAFIYQQMLNLSEKCKSNSPAYRNELFHEVKFDSLARQTNYFLYKGASNGSVFRAAWRYDNEEDRMYINYFWLDHDKYVLQAEEAKGFVEDMGSFIDISEDVYSINTMR